MACLSGLGAECKFDVKKPNFIFDESFSRAIVGVKDEGKFESLAAKHGVKFEKIGSVGGDKFKLNDIDEKLSDVSEVYFSEFAKIIKQES